MTSVDGGEMLGGLLLIKWVLIVFIAPSNDGFD